MRFVKAHGAGNDFILLPDFDDRWVLTPALARTLCQPHTGLGGDGVIRLAPPRDRDRADVFMDYRNADGSLSQMCGNGVRCVAKYVIDRGLVTASAVRVDTCDGVKDVVVAARDDDGRVRALRVDMGAPVPGKIDVPLEVDGETVAVTTLSMGNPHAVVVCDDVATAPVATLGPALAGNSAFPDGTNVEFIAAPDRATVIGRIWERGVGETRASGTGASAMAAAAHLLGMADRSVTVRLPGGDLQVEWSEETLHVTGPAVEVASGMLDPAWLAAVDGTDGRGGARSFERRRLDQGGAPAPTLEP